MGEFSPPSIEILGCRLDALDAAAAAERILALARQGSGAHIVTLGTEMVVHAQRDGRYRGIVNRCALSLCDTVGLLAIARLRGVDLHERVTGVELVDDLCAAAAREGLSVFLLGGAPGIAQRAAQHLMHRFPGLVVAGARSGYFDDAQSPGIATEIRTSGAALLFAGMGFPRQEYWLSEYLGQTGCGAGIGVGGSFDVISGAVQRAPERWRRLGLEWLYRLITQPHRWRRQLALPHFIALVCWDSFRSRVTSGKHAKKREETRP